MADEKKVTPGVWMRVAWRLSDNLYRLTIPPVYLGTLTAAMVEAALSIVFGWRFALASVATALVAVGQILAHGALGIEFVSSLVQRIQLDYAAEIKNAAAEPKQRAAPEPSLPRWRN